MAIHTTLIFNAKLIKFREVKTKKNFFKNLTGSHLFSIKKYDQANKNRFQ